MQINNVWSYSIKFLIDLCYPIGKGTQINALNTFLFINSNEPKNRYSSSGICVSCYYARCFFGKDKLSLQLNQGVFDRSSLHYLFNNP